MKKLTVTALRSQIYSVIDEIVETGKPIEFERKGHMIKISLDKNKNKNKLDNLIPHNSIVGDPNELINVKTSEWDEKKNL